MATDKRAENAALALPVFGALLMVPPLLSVFNVPEKLFGIPLVALYLFTLWIALIAAAMLLFRRRTEEQDNSGEIRGESDETP